MIEGKVAAIVNSRELAINRGRDHGVTEGMRFEVMETPDTQIIDPETHESLGTIELVKIRVRVTVVEARFSIAETYETIGGGLTPIFAYSALLGTTPRLRTLNTDDALVKPLAEGGSFVKRGDIVRQIEEADEDSSGGVVLVPPEEEPPSPDEALG